MLRPASFVVTKGCNSLSRTFPNWHSEKSGRYRRLDFIPPRRISGDGRTSPFRGQSGRSGIGATLLGGGCHRSRCCNRSMGAEEGADMAHRQRNLVWSVLPRIKADLRIGREMHGLHRYGIGVPRNVVGHTRIGVWQLRTKSRVTVYTKSARAPPYMLVRKVSTIAIVMSGRRAHSSGPQPFMLLL